jgi:ankyrin repeat protein
MDKTAEELAAQNGHTQIVALLRQRRDADDERAVERLRDRFESVPTAEVERLIEQGSPDLRRRILDAAFVHERTEVVRRLLARAGGPAGPDRFDLDSPRRVGAAAMAPVAWCALRGDSETLDALLGRGASPRAAHGDKTALVLAVEAGHLRVVEALIGHGAPASTEALAAAIAARQLAAGRLVLQRGASFDPRTVAAIANQDNMEFIDRLVAGTPAAAQVGEALVQAIASGRLDAARALARSRVTAGSQRAAAFLRAVEAGYLSLADLIGRDGIDGPTLDEALIAAVSRANTAAVRQLLARGASADARASGPRERPTALMLAARLLDVDTVGVLLDAGADFAARDAAGNDAAWYARQGNADGRSQRDELKVTNRLQAALER